MTYVLYGDRRSGSATIELALAEIGASIELRDVALDEHVQRDDEYARVNPQRKLPTLITPDGETLTESAAILLTLAERYPAARLLPALDDAERAHALRWLVYVAAELYPLIEIIDYPERYQPEGDATSIARRDAIRDSVRSIWKERWTLVERQCAGDTAFLSGGFSVLDIYIAVVSRWAQLDSWRAQNLANVEGITKRIASRPRCAAVWSRHFG